LFTLHELPTGIRGLVFAGLFAAGMSSLDSAICAIGATWVSDVAPRSDGSNGRDQTARIQRLTVWICLALAAAAVVMARYQDALASRGAELPSLVEFALSAMSILYGGLLGVFATGFLVAGRGNDRSAALGLAVGGAIGLALFLQPLFGGTSWLAWGYRIPIAAAATAAVVVLRPQTRLSSPR